MIKQYKNKRERIKAGIRSKIKGTKERLRLNVFRSSKYIYAQLIDDNAGKTLAVSLSKKITEVDNKTKTDSAKAVGADIAALALKQGVKTVVFDRGGYIYKGRVKALAEGAREGGLIF